MLTGQSLKPENERAVRNVGHCPAGPLLVKDQSIAQHKTINEIYDICAVRVIVDTVADCYNVLGYVHDLYKPIPGLWWLR